jgi:hypothetical protein
MKRFCALAVLMLLGSPAEAGDSFSFVIGGRHIHIERSRHCNSASCVSVSIPGVYEKRARRDRYDDDDTRSAQPAASAAAPVAQPQVAPVACAPAAAPARPTASQIAAALQPQIQPPPVQSVAVAAVPPPPAAPPAGASPPSPPPPPPVIARPAEAALPPEPVIAPPPRVNKVVHRVEQAPDSPLGDWVTEGNKGTVRIEPCGQALCGYVLDRATETRGEAVLIDMKSKTTSEWTGNIYSRDSGDTYYATMTLKDPNTIEVEACALWRFWCSGNAWSRIPAPKRLLSSRQL